MHPPGSSWLFWSSLPNPAGQRTAGPAAARSGPATRAAAGPGTGSLSVEDPRHIVTPPATPPSILVSEIRPIDLIGALRLANVENPELNIARTRILEAAAMRQLAAAYFLPSINPGVSYDSHTGVLQQSNGNILAVNRSSVYRGGGGERGRGGDREHPGGVLFRERRLRNLRLPGQQAGRAGARVRDAGGPQPDAAPGRHGLQRVAPRRRPAGRANPGAR